LVEDLVDLSLARNKLQFPKLLTALVELDKQDPVDGLDIFRPVALRDIAHLVTDPIERQYCLNCGSASLPASAEPLALLT
jgi:hypothetical protein